MHARLSELGIKADMPKPIGKLPPGGAKWTVPHYQTFAGITNFYSRSYPQTFDEAMRDSRENALAMRRHPVIAGAIRKLIQPIAQLEWKLKPRREDDPQLQADADMLTEVLKEWPRPGLTQYFRMLLESRFYGRYGVSKIFGWSSEPYRETRLQVKSFRPVNGDKIVFRWDDRPGILVNAGSYDGATITTERGMCHFLTDDELEAFSWSEFEPEDADYYEGWAAGVIHGQGFRGRLYLLFWLEQKVTEAMLRFLRRAAGGWNVAYFDMHGDLSRDQLKTDLAEYDSEDVLLFPKTREEKSPYSFEHHPVSLTGAQIYLDVIKWIHDLMDAYILGEVLTTGVGATGMGSGVSEAHQDTADDRTKYHAADVVTAIQPVVNTLARYNCPGRPAPWFEFVMERRNPAEYAAAAQTAYGMGVGLDAEDIRENLKLKKPKEGSEIIAKVSPGQPAAMGDAPAGMPVAGTPGPEQSGQQPGVNDGQAGTMSQDQGPPI